MNADRLEMLLRAIASVRVAVVGDYFLDRYGRGEVRGISRETGRRVLRLERHSFSPGGTGNVAANAAALGVSVVAVGVLGQDAYAQVYRDDLAQRGIDAGYLLTDPGRHTASFEKFLVQRPRGRLREVRLDVDNRTPVSAAVTEQLCTAVDTVAGVADGLIVADYEEYGAGVITAPVLDRLLQAAWAGRIPCLVMSRSRVTEFLPFVPVQNEYEVMTQTGLGKPGLFDQVVQAEVARAAAALLGGGAPLVFVTRGRQGISAFTPDGRETLVPTVAAPGPVDTCGAGDTVLAAVAAALSAGAEPVEAALLGNCAAYVTVQKLGTTGTASPEEVRAAFRDLAAAGASY